MANNIPEDYEDALTRLLKPKDERVYDTIADSVCSINDITIRLQMAKVIKAGVDPAAVTYFLNWLNRNASGEKFTELICSLPLTQSSVFKKHLEAYFNIPEIDSKDEPLIRLLYITQ